MKELLLSFVGLRVRLYNTANEMGDGPFQFNLHGELDYDQAEDTFLVRFPKHPSDFGQSYVTFKEEAVAEAQTGVSGIHNIRLV